MSSLGTDRLAGLAELEQLADDVFAATPSAGNGRMYGGEVAARALAAAQRTVPPERAVHVVQANYLSPGDPSAVLLMRVTRLRDGRAFAMRRVDVAQRDRIIFTSIMSFQVGAVAVEHQDRAVEHQDRMPAVPSPEELATTGEWAGGQRYWPDWVIGDAAIELRPVPGEEWEPAGLRAIWCRLGSVDAAAPGLEACRWLWASDLTLVSSIRLPHEPTERKSWLMTSLNHTVWFHRPFPVDEWHLVVHRSPLAVGGRGLALGQVFTRDGALVSSLAQEGLATPLSSSL